MDIRLFDVDPKLHRQFKILCAMEGISQNQKLQQMIRDAVKAAGLDK